MSGNRTAGGGSGAAVAVIVCLLAAAAAGCRQDMHDQPKYNPLLPNDFFEDGRSARPLVEGTVPRGEAAGGTLVATGRIDGQLATAFPFAITAEVMARGRERYDIFCSPCHARTGNGDGMVVRRGYRAPPSFHNDRLRQAPPGHFFDVITNGFGAMPDYRQQVPARDRWAIIAYVRALQESSAASIADVPADQRDAIRPAGGTAPAAKNAADAKPATKDHR